MREILFLFSVVSNFDEFLKANEYYYYTREIGKGFHFFWSSFGFAYHDLKDTTQDEFHQAIMILQMREKWLHAQHSKDNFSYIEIDAVIDGTTRPLERKLNGVCKHIDDPFWDTYFPPNFSKDRSTIRLHWKKCNSKKSNFPIPEEGFIRNVCKPFRISPQLMHFIIYNTPENIEAIKKYFENKNKTS